MFNVFSLLVVGFLDLAFFILVCYFKFFASCVGFSVEPS